VPFSTVIELAFSLGIPEEQYKSEEARAQAYFNQQDECRDLLTAARFGEAEISCRKAAELAELAPAERVGRYFAYQQVGHAFFYQRKFAEALTWYQRELEVADAKLKTDNAELGYAYRDVAFARHGNGDLEHAEPYYRRALQILEEAREHIRSEFLKNEYSRIMKNMLQPYAMLLRETGQLKEAEAMEQRANAIVIKEGLKDD
jgi:tetratricopeptide (TPR) repeat protein